MKLIFILGFFTLVVINADKCKDVPPTIPTEWANMLDLCTKKVKGQIREEINAAMIYMAMGAHFSRDVINRPGFAKLFFEAATEERHHAIKLIEYLLMRGDLFKNLNSLIDSFPKPPKTEWTNGFEALTEAVKLETEVTKKIITIIKECEGTNKKTNDYHAVDYLTEDFLEEQYRGERDLAGKASMLGKMIRNNSSLAEFLFDKKLYHDEL